MKIFTFFFALLMTFSAFGEESSLLHQPQKGREPARQRIEICDKNGESSPYMRPIAWQSQEDGSLISNTSIPFAWANRQVLLRIASAPGGYRVVVNGKEVGHVTTGALPAEFNLTKRIKNDTLNRIELIPLVHHPIRSLEAFYHPDTWGESELIAQPTIRIRDVRCSLHQTGDGWLAEVGIVVKSDALNEKSARIDYRLHNSAGELHKQGFSQLRLRMRGEDTLRFTTLIPDSMLWSPNSPTHYQLSLTTQTQGRYTEYITLPIAFRQIALEADNLTINGQPFQPNGYEVRNPLHKEDLLRIQSLGYNLLILSPGVPAEELCQWCDELGLCVVATAPYCSQQAGPSRQKGGNPSNDPSWVMEAIDRAEATYKLLHRHPSVIAFAIAKDSANGICLYESYLHMKSFGDSRPILYTECEGEWNSDCWIPMP